VVNIFGRAARAAREVAVLNSFSGHADRNELVTYLKRFAPPRSGQRSRARGSGTQSEKLGAVLRESGFPDVGIPARGQKVHSNKSEYGLPANGVCAPVAPRAGCAHRGAGGGAASRDALRLADSASPAQFDRIGFDRIYSTFNWVGRISVDTAVAGTGGPPGGTVLQQCDRDGGARAGSAAKFSTDQNVLRLLVKRPVSRDIRGGWTVVVAPLFGREERWV